MLKNAQKEAWETACNRYEIKKAEHERLCQKLRNGGIKIRDLPPKPKRVLQKDVFEEIREKWEKGIEMDMDLMDIDEEEVSEFGDDCEVEVSPFHGDDGEVGSGWDGSNEGDEEEQDEDEDLMDVDEP